MSVFSQVVRASMRWQRRRARRQAAMLVASLPVDLQRDLGWPAMWLSPAARNTRLLG